MQFCSGVNSRSMLVNIHFSKRHIWKCEKMTNTSTCNIFGFEEFLNLSGTQGTLSARQCDK